MVSAWYMDEHDQKDQRLPHKTGDPKDSVSLEVLKEKTGVLYFKIESEEQLSGIRKKRGYNYEDNIKIDKDLDNYEKKLKDFFTEHLHSDEEIRYCEEGSGYFDVRDGEDKWIRVELNPGDMIILPAGIYHRFTLDTNNYIKARRYFVGVPVWTPINRPANEHPARVNYIKDFPQVAQTAQ